MRRVAAVAMGLFVLHATAWAENLEQKPPTFRASASFGVAGRESNQNDSRVLPLTYRGFSPTIVHLAGAGFFLSWLGVAIDASFENFVIQGRDLNNPMARLPLSGFRLLGTLVGRWSVLPYLGLELHLGYGGGIWPGITLTGGSVTAQPIGWHGPSLGFAVAIEPDWYIGGQLFGRITPALGGSELRPLSFSSGFQLHFGKLAVGNLRGAVLLEGELIGNVGHFEEPPVISTMNQIQLRFAIGIRVRHQPPPPEKAIVGPKPGTGRIRGRVVTAGVGLAGVLLTAGTLPQQTSGPDGDFELADVPPGHYTLKAVLTGYKLAEESVDVPAGDEAVVTLALTRPTGPGRITGLVKGEKDAPVADAELTVEGRPAVKSKPDGTYAIELAGPGPVKISVKAKGYQPAEEAAQVPPEGVATLDFTLLKAGEKQLATIRGLVRAATGKAVRGTVKISEVNQTIAIKGDGRFVVQVPGGKYTLTIEAAGFVSQVKTVEVADGDQAIFHCDLQPAGR